MRAGLLREIITIQGITETKDQYGAVTTSFADRCNIRARVVASGNREIQGNEVVHGYTLTFTVRISSVITESDRIIYDSKKYRILSIVKNSADMSRTIVGELINE